MLRAKGMTGAFLRMDMVMHLAGPLAGAYLDVFRPSGFDFRVGVVVCLLKEVIFL